MIKLGITGGIGTGKSTVLSLLKEQGVIVWSADTVVGDIYRTDSIFHIFLKKICETKGLKNVQELKTRLNNYPQVLTEIESYVHPLVYKAREDFFLENKEAKIVACEIPLLYENKLDTIFDYVLVTDVPKNVQWERCKTCKGMTLDIFTFLKTRQLDEKDKCKRASFVIKMDRPLKEVKLDVILLLNEIKSRKENRHA